MRMIKKFLILLILATIASCAKPSFETPPPAPAEAGGGGTNGNIDTEETAPPEIFTESIISPTELRNLGTYYEHQIPRGSDEYNRMLETYVYGKWVITRVLIEPIEDMDKEAQNIIVGTKVEFSKDKITNDFTEEKRELTNQYKNPSIREIEIVTEIDNPDYIIEELSLWQFVGGSDIVFHQGAYFEFNYSEDLFNVTSIVIPGESNKYFRWLGTKIAIRDESTLILYYGYGYWELKRVE